MNTIPLLQPGDSDAGSAIAWVSALQSALTEIGYGTPRTGVFDVQTQEGVTSYQLGRAIPLTGTGDAATMQKIAMEIGSRFGPTSGMRLELYPLAAVGWALLGIGAEGQGEGDTVGAEPPLPGIPWYAVLIGVGVIGVIAYAASRR